MLKDWIGRSKWYHVFTENFPRYTQLFGVQITNDLHFSL